MMPTGLGLMGFVARRRNKGFEARTATPEEFAASMATDLKKWAKVVAAAGIKVER